MNLASRNPPFRRWICFLSLALILSGCAQYHAVTLDSLARANANPISYSIRTAHPLRQEDAALYVETANLVRTALSGRGLYEAPPQAEPDVVVDIDFGVGPARVHREKLLRPLGGWSGQAAVWNRDPAKEIYIEGAPPMAPPQIKTEEYEIVSTTYEKYLRLTAHERVARTADRPPMEIWTVDATSEGESSDLQEYLPILAAASIDYIGRDSHGQKTIRLKDSDADVAFVKKGM